MTTKTISETNTASYEQIELPALGSTLIERVLCFRTHLKHWWRNQHPHIAHVRSIYEGYPIARRKDNWCDQLVLEINGLPSIELKYHYPQVADDRELMHKFIAQEQACLDKADLILTVSQVNAAHLLQRGVPANRLCVIPNGADTTLFPYQPPKEWGDREISLLYSGTFSTWQGVQVAIEALGLCRRQFPARLTIVGSGRAGQIRMMREFAAHLNIGDQLQILESVSQPELALLHHAADVVLVPLMPNDRNLVQGCSPLKLLEAMSSGTPVIASEMPVVTELARHEVEALLVRPGSPKAIAEGLIRLRHEPALRLRISKQARKRVEQHFTWQLSQRRLIEAYRRLT